MGAARQPHPVQSMRSEKGHTIKLLRRQRTAATGRKQATHATLISPTSGQAFTPTIYAGRFANLLPSM